MIMVCQLILIDILFLFIHFLKFTFYIDHCSEKRTELSYVIINPNCDLKLEEGDIIYIIKPSPVNSKKMFLTRGGSIRSKSPLKGKGRRGHHGHHHGSKGGGNDANHGDNGTGGQGLGYALKMPDLDVVSMISNSGSSIYGCGNGDSNMANDKPNSKVANGSSSSTTSSANSSAASLPDRRQSEDQNDQLMEMNDFSSINMTRRTPPLSKLKGKTNFLSLDGIMSSSTKTSSSKNSTTNKKRKNKKSKNKNQPPPPPTTTTPSTSFYSGQRTNLAHLNSIRLPLINQQPNNSSTDHESDGNDSGSSGDIILPAITVPKNYDGNIHSIQSNQATTSSPSSMAMKSGIVKICIDSPSEEEHSLKLSLNESTNTNNGGNGGNVQPINHSGSHKMMV